MTLRPSCGPPAGAVTHSARRGVQGGMRCFVIVVLAGCRTGPSTDQFVVGGDVVALSVRVDSGIVRVRASAHGSGEAADSAAGEELPSGGVRVTRTQTGAVEGRRRVVHGVLEIDARCAAWLPCESRLDIEIPAGMPVDVEVGDGAVELEGVAGEVTVNLGSGQLRVWDAAAPQLRAQVGWGDSDLDFRVAPRELRVSAGGGDVRVGVPSGAYDLDLSALGGQYRRGVSQEAGAGLISLTTSSGQVSVNGY